MNNLDTSLSSGGSFKRLNGKPTKQNNNFIKHIHINHHVEATTPLRSTHSYNMMDNPQKITTTDIYRDSNHMINPFDQNRQN